MSAGEMTLSLVPGSEESPAPETSFPVLVLLGLTFADGRRPLEVAFCSDHQGERILLIKAGARRARCGICETRHRVVGLVQAVAASAINTGYGMDAVGPTIELADFLSQTFHQ